MQHLDTAAEAAFGALRIFDRSIPVLIPPPGIPGYDACGPSIGPGLTSLPSTLHWETLGLGQVRHLYSNLSNPNTRHHPNTTPVEAYLPIGLHLKYPLMSYNYHPSPLSSQHHVERTIGFLTDPQSQGQGQAPGEHVSKDLLTASTPKLSLRATKVRLKRKMKERNRMKGKGVNEVE